LIDTICIFTAAKCSFGNTFIAALFLVFGTLTNTRGGIDDADHAINRTSNGLACADTLRAHIPRCTGIMVIANIRIGFV